MKRLGVALAVLLMVISAGLPAAKVLGLDIATDAFYSLNNILFYDPNACSPSTGDPSGGGSSLAGNDNLEKALRFYVGKGLTLNQASGILGNFGRESGVNPAIIQGDIDYNENGRVDSGDIDLNHNGRFEAPKIVTADYKLVAGWGFGIAQWTDGGRQQLLTSLSKSSNKDIIDLGLQLEFSWQELQNGYKTALTNLKATTTPEDAAYVFHRDYEGSADSESQVKAGRGGDAKQIASQYRTVIKDGAETSEAGASGDATCSGEGDSLFVDGFAIYNQSDRSKPWASLPYGPGKDVAAAGCGPSAMAMIITALTKTTVTPSDTATYGASHGTIYVLGGVGAGSYHNIHSVIGGHWGLKSTNMNKSIPKINEGLRAGGLVILAGSGSAPFTQGGHFIAVRAVTGSNKWLIGDSNGTVGLENSKKEWDPVYIMSMVGSYSWLLTK